mmetsp:Transcript_44581/g.110514  ORF Transcript_44581/g.110514 Transcript_44581/m.110514 type:complete len:265 (+) Transcript_44581:697-1491(+)
MRLVILSNHRAECPNDFDRVDLVGHREERLGREAEAVLDQRGDKDRVAAEVLRFVQLGVLRELCVHRVGLERAHARRARLDGGQVHLLLAVDLRIVVDEPDLLGAIVHVGEADELAHQLGLERALDRARRERALRLWEDTLDELHARCVLAHALHLHLAAAGRRHRAGPANGHARVQHLALLGHDRRDGAARFVEPVAKVALHVHLLGAVCHRHVGEVGRGQRGLRGRLEDDLDGAAAQVDGPVGRLLGGVHDLHQVVDRHPTV